MAIVNFPWPGDLYQALVNAGYTLPKNTAEVEIKMPLDGMFQLVLIINVDEELLQQLGEAFIDMAMKNKTTP